MKTKIFLSFLLVGIKLMSATNEQANPADWYTPEDFKVSNELDCKMIITDRRGDKNIEVPYKIYFDEKTGEVSHSTLKEKLNGHYVDLRTAIELIDQTLLLTAENRVDLALIAAQIKTLGENLTKVFQQRGFSVKLGDKTYTIKVPKDAFRKAVMEGSPVEAIDQDELFHVPDEKSISRLPNGQIQIKGWDQAANKESFWELKDPGGSVMFRSEKGPEYSVSFLPYYGVDKLSLAPNSKTKKLELESWSLKNVCKETLSKLLLSDSPSQRESHHIVTRYNDKIHYLPIGEAIPTNGLVVKVDGQSITTNYVDGAVVEGEMSLYGWKDAPDISIPYRSDDHLQWATIEEIIDNKSIGKVPDDNGQKIPKLEIKGASEQEAEGRYFGTSIKGATLGWHDLPNITTNYVAGDEISITTKRNSDGEKVLGWKRMPPIFPSAAWMTPEGEIEWTPIYEFTNLVSALAMDDKSIATNSTGSLELKGWENASPGVVFKNPEGNLAVSENPADYPITFYEDQKFGLVGWTNQVCEAKLSEMLTKEDEKGNRENHYLLARFGKGDSAKLHYVPFGNVIKASGNALRLVGTDEEEVIIGSGSETNTVRFQSALDSNVKVEVDSTSDNEVTITFGVYYQ